MKELLVLAPENPEQNKPTKILDSKLNKLKTFDAGYKFYFETLEYNCFHQAMKNIFTRDDSFMVLGELTEFGRNLEEAQKPGPRRKKKGTPTIQDRLGTEIVLDLDDHIIHKFRADKPEPAIKNWLAEKGINCNVTWQLTSGQKLNTKEARIRLYFEASKPLPLLERKAWAQSPEIQADGSVFTCSQPIFTAPPIIEGGDDPIKVRTGFIQGSTRTFTVPKRDKKFIEKHSGYMRGGEAWDFDDKTLPGEVLNGSVYRRYLMPLAFHYANKLKDDRNAIFAIIVSKAMQVKSREFDADNVYAYIDDAIAKIGSEEQPDTSGLATAAEIRSEEKQAGGAPQFPEGWMQKLPHPWPMIWENFARIPLKCEEALLTPTILSTHAFFLRSNFVTVRGRRPNFFFLNLAPSTGYKDVNSKNVIRDLDTIFKRKGPKSTLFSGILNTESSITADTSFLESFNENDEFFWIDTESSRIFHQMNAGRSNSHVAAISDKLIEVVDGHRINGKRKAGGKIVRSIEDPTVEIIFYAQPETIERYIDESMVDSGLFGRALLSINPDLGFDKDTYDAFESEVGGINVEIDDDFFDFYNSDEFKLSKFSSGKIVLKPNDKSMKLLKQWGKEFLNPLMAEGEVYQKILPRIAISAEQLYCVVLGICQIWDRFVGEVPRKEIGIEWIFPLLEYWVETKIYAVKHFVNTEIDPLHAGILEVIRKGIKMDYKVTQSQRKIIEEHNVFPKSLIMKNVKQNQRLVNQLRANNDDKNVSQRIDRELNLLCRSNILEVAHFGNRTKIPCYGIVKG